jgi:hypothetical protein
VASVANARGACVLDGRRLGDCRPRNGRDQFGDVDSQGVGESDHSRQAGAVFAALYPAIGSHVDTDELSEFDLSQLPPLSDVPQLLAEEVRDGLLATGSGEGPNRCSLMVAWACHSATLNGETGEVEQRSCEDRVPPEHPPRWRFANPGHLGVMSRNIGPWL